MTTPTTRHTAPARDLTGGRRHTTLVASPAISQTIGYGTLYHAFAVLLARWPST